MAVITMALAVLAVGLVLAVILLLRKDGVVLVWLQAIVLRWYKIKRWLERR